MAEEIHLRSLEGYTDSQLISLMKNGNPDAFLELTTRYMSLIRAKAAPFHSTMLEVDDLCQEGLMGLLDATHTYREDGGASFRTYAGVCVGNRIVMAYRWAAGRKNLPLNNFVSLSEARGAEGVSLQAADNPEEWLMDDERFQLLKQYIGRNLSKMEHQVLMLYLGGYSYQEIAESLHIASKAADNALQRVRRKLKEPF